MGYHSSLFQIFRSRQPLKFTEVRSILPFIYWSWLLHKWLEKKVNNKPSCSSKILVEGISIFSLDFFLIFKFKVLKNNQFFHLGIQKLKMFNSKNIPSTLSFKNANCTDSIWNLKDNSNANYGRYQLLTTTKKWSSPYEFGKFVPDLPWKYGLYQFNFFRMYCIVVHIFLVLLYSTVLHENKCSKWMSSVCYVQCLTACCLICVFLAKDIQ